MDVRDQYAYTSLMASPRDTLVATFARGGYLTVALMPGMRQAWPEGAFYGFDAIYGHDRLEYEGPPFGWWSIPDQYALAKLDLLERSRTSRAPLFVVFPTSTTHAPFDPVAPYQPDWSRVLMKNLYDEADVARARAARPDLTNLRPSYVRAVAYAYASLAGYSRDHAGDDVVMIAIGDHQPPAAVSGKDAPWHVPVHVIASREDILGRLREHGFHPGLEPRRPSLGAMHALAPMPLDAFAAPASTPPRTARRHSDLHGTAIVSNQRRPITADPGKSGSAVPRHFGTKSLEAVCGRLACKFLRGVLARPQPITRQPEKTSAAKACASAGVSAAQTRRPCSASWRCVYAPWRSVRAS
ncbi:MAG: hypothetical protein HY657_14010 [Acidobacteria bacterium]|nr:hypothetical protein [Acidobacteriota bacterium]